MPRLDTWRRRPFESDASSSRASCFHFARRRATRCCRILMSMCMVKSWDRVFQKVFTTAKLAIKGGHPHRFRDTFAVSLLLKGVSIEIVSKLLGHRSIKVTERHYSPWVKARQDQLETEVRRIWSMADAATV
jgi:integrase